MEIKAFENAIDEALKSKVDFIIICGDLFHSNIPNMEAAKRTTKKLKDVRDKEIPIYVIYGSHDYSPTNTSMIDILESAGLITKVFHAKACGKIKLEFIEDNTGAKICGINARQRSIEKEYFRLLDMEYLEKEKGFKIFMFHTAIKELIPKDLPEIEGIAKSSLPRNFNYYAGGHLHEKIIDEEEMIFYPGTLFGPSFKDLEKTASGLDRGFYIVEFDDEVKKYEFKNVDVAEYEYIKLNNFDNMSPLEARTEIINKLNEKNVENKIVLIKVYGELNGKVSSIDFQGIKRHVLNNGAIYVAINYHNLKSKEQAKVKVRTSDANKIEEKIFSEKIKNIDIKNPLLKNKIGVRVSKELLRILRQPMKPGEKKKDYEERILEESMSIFNIK